MPNSFITSLRRLVGLLENDQPVQRNEQPNLMPGQIYRSFTIDYAAMEARYAALRSAQEEQARRHAQELNQYVNTAQYHYGTGIIDLPFGIEVKVEKLQAKKIKRNLPEWF